MKYIKYRFFIPLALAALCVVGSSCSKMLGYDTDPVDKPDENGEVTVHMNFTTPNIDEPSTRAFNDIGEGQVNDVDVLVFDKNNKLAYCKQATSVTNTDPRNKTFSVALKVSTDAADLYHITVLANSRAKITSLTAASSLNVGVTYDAVCTAMEDTTPTTVPASWSKQEIPMWGEIAMCEIKPTTKSYNLQLVRSFARIDVGVGAILDANSKFTSWGGLTNFSLDAVILYKPNKFKRLIPGVGNYNPTTFEITKPTLPTDNSVLSTVTFADITKINTFGAFISSDIYVGEADVDKNNGAGVANDNNHLNRMSIVIKGRYGVDVNPSATATYYRIDFIQPKTLPSDPDKLLNILRNHLYRINIKKVLGPGHSTEAEAWNSKAVNMTVEIFTINEGATNTTVYDGRYMFSIDSKPDLTFPPEGNKEEKIITIKTNIPDWQYNITGSNLNIPTIVGVTNTNVDNTTGFSYAVTYTAAPVVGSDIYTYTLKIIATKNNVGAGVPRAPLYGYFKVTAKNLFLGMTVTQPGGILEWAPSNTTLSSDGLRLIISSDPNEQGLLFKYGSLVGLKLPANATNGDAFSMTNNVVWSVTGNVYSNYSNIPFTGVINAPNFDPDPQYNLTASRQTLAVVKADKGDPCRLIGLTKTEIAAGKVDNGVWRSPTYDELLLLMPVEVNFSNTPPYGCLFGTYSIFLPAGGCLAPAGNDAAISFPPTNARNYRGNYYGASYPYFLYLDHADRTDNLGSTGVGTKMSGYGYAMSSRCVRSTNKASLMTLSSKTLAIPSTTGSVTLNASGGWAAISSDPTWLSVTPSGYGSSTVNITATVNVGAVRIGTITFIQPGYEIKLTVEQAGEPNCYIVAPSGSVTIPVKKAYDVWPKAPLNTTLTGVQTASILWQDATNGGVASGASISGAGADAKITVNAGAMEGNAVVVLSVGGVVRWSWHIWVCATNNDPRITGNTNSYTNAYTSNGFTMMGRNLGAVNNIPGDVKSLGYLYQWGRKDPFPGPSITTSTFTNKTIYSGTGNSAATFAFSATSGLSLALQNPLTFYFLNNEWYGKPMDLYLWLTAIGNKADYDPCPAGWRVPPAPNLTLASSPWAGLPTPTFSTGKGADWTNLTPSRGYYPAAGEQFSSGAPPYLLNIGASGFYQLSTPLYSNDTNTKYGSQVRIQSDNSVTIYNNYNADGCSVRCVKL